MAEAGWSSGALGLYFATRAELLAFACEEVIDRVGTRIAALPPVGTPRERVRAILHEAMPLDGPRATETSIAFSFVALGLSNPSLAAVQREHFDDMYAMCHKLVTDLAANDLLAQPISDPDLLAARLHALVDGLSLHGLAGHRTAPR
ncbi:TetR/AcrR family transcriptional regulator [Nocardia brasiliensis]|uniref:TetR/AcrR family transcriptional regulator n=1 Tax=Nocardia brasiliensis TaxID=37326 RepID=UPI001893D68F|nr:TetR family transcriptional regulator C-terminal domain-containing protein [Nocardia brasiliensis]MBF6546633.1 TetR family transcriptional regulator C-terminal domain-containing protein [Nocardia brasiliensis]